MWKAIRSFFVAAREDQSDTQHLAPVDAEAIASELDVHTRGASDGRKGTPASDANAFTLTEVEITGRFQQEAHNALSFFRGKILDLHNIAKQKSLTKLENELKGIAPQFKAEMDAVFATIKAQLIDAKHRENELQDEYRTFRRRNKLTRLATYPDSRIFLVSVLLAILGVEAILNGYFFAKANEFGLVGGTGQALITAGINIAIGWFFGRFAFTQMHHCAPIRRYTAMLVVPIMFVGVVVLYNLFIGHFRDELAAGVDAGAIEYGAVGKDVLSSVLSDPSGLQNFDSWLLVLLGIVFALVAAIDGYFFNDPYPGYGRVARRYDNARRDYLDDKNGLVMQLLDLRDDAREQIESIKAEIETQGRSIHNLVTWSKRREQEAKSYFNDLGMKCNHVLRLYRTSNSAARRDLPPEYFGHVYNLLDDVDTKIEPVDVGEIQKQVSNVDQMSNRAIRASRELQKIYTDFTDRIAKEIEEIETS